MLRGLGAHMEPSAAGQQQQQQQQLAPETLAPAGGDKSSAGARRLAVNSDLVAFSIVADSAARAPTKVDLAAPIELVFRHNSQLPASVVNAAGLSGHNQAQPPTGPARPAANGAQCVYWDTKAR
jgi:hypothetical protein